MNKNYFFSENRKRLAKLKNIIEYLEKEKKVINEKRKTEFSNTQTLEEKKKIKEKYFQKKENLENKKNKLKEEKIILRKQQKNLFEIHRKKSFENCTGLHKITVFQNLLKNWIDELNNSDFQEL